MAEVTELCDRVLVLKRGAIIADNTPELLAQSIAKVQIRFDHFERPRSCAYLFAQRSVSILFCTEHSNNY